MRQGRPKVAVVVILKGRAASGFVAPTLTWAEAAAAKLSSRAAVANFIVVLLVAFLNIIFQYRSGCWSSAVGVSNFLKGNGVHTVAEAARLRAVGENVAEMRLAGVADGFDAFQKGGPVEVIGDDVRFDGLGEGRPASMGLEFLAGIEEKGFAADASVESGLKQAAHFGAESTFCAGQAGDLVLGTGQLFAPFRVGFDDFVGGDGVTVGGEG